MPEHAPFPWDRKRLGSCNVGVKTGFARFCGTTPVSLPTFLDVYELGNLAAFPAVSVIAQIPIAMRCVTLVAGERGCLHCAQWTSGMHPAFGVAPSWFNA